MAFDFNEARAIIEQAKLQGLIRPPGSPDPVSKNPEASDPATEHLPDWLKKGIREPKSGEDSAENKRD